MCCSITFIRINFNPLPDFRILDWVDKRLTAYCWGQISYLTSHCMRINSDYLNTKKQVRITPRQVRSTHWTTNPSSGSWAQSLALDQLTVEFTLYDSMSTNLEWRKLHTVTKNSITIIITKITFNNWNFWTLNPQNSSVIQSWQRRSKSPYFASDL